MNWRILILNIRNNPIQYFVEGETEKAFIEQVKNKYILSGKISVLNVLQNEIKYSRLINIKPKTTIILIFDTDVEKENLLNSKGIFNSIAYVESSCCLHAFAGKFNKNFVKYSKFSKKQLKNK